MKSPKRNVRQEAFSLVLKSSMPDSSPSTKKRGAKQTPTKPVVDPSAFWMAGNDSRFFYGDSYHLSARHRIQFRTPHTAGKLKGRHSVRTDEIYTANDSVGEWTTADQNLLLGNGHTRLDLFSSPTQSETPQVATLISNSHTLSAEYSDQGMKSELEAGEYTIVVKASGHELQAACGKPHLDNLLSTRPFSHRGSFRTNFILEKVDGTALWKIRSKVNAEPLSFNSSDKLISVRRIDGTAGNSRGYTEDCCFKIEPTTLGDDSYNRDPILDQ